jgi:hypothetical protein
MGQLLLSVPVCYGGQLGKLAKERMFKFWDKAIYEAKLGSMNENESHNGSTWCAKLPNEIQSEIVFSSVADCSLVRHHGQYGKFYRAETCRPTNADQHSAPAHVKCLSKYLAEVKSVGESSVDLAALNHHPSLAGMDSILAVTAVTSIPQKPFSCKLSFG